MITIVSATRLSTEDFWSKSALGQSLNRIAFDKRLNARINANNTLPLPTVYNYSIAAAQHDDILVFMHDDVWIDDYYFSDRIIEGLKSFDIIGVAGSKQRRANQPSWLFTSLDFQQDVTENLSGSIAHGKNPCGGVSHYGATPAACDLLDGVLLATSKTVLTQSGLMFDPLFAFHFYDLDFCRSAKLRRLRLGTWPICLTHQSAGSFGSPDWRDMQRLYAAKWPD
jgi:GT2 family glycosyltransferase